MKRWAILIAIAGLTAAVFLVLKNNAAAVWQLMRDEGAGVLLVAAFHLLPLGCSAGALMMLGDAGRRPSFLEFVAARMLREGVNDLLPAAHIGGVAASARVLVLRGWRRSEALAGSLVDIPLEAGSQVVFVMLGVVALLIDGRAPHAAMWALCGAGLLGISLAILVHGLRVGAVRAIGRWMRRFASSMAAGDAADEIHTRVQDLYRHRKRLLIAAGLHLVCWIIGAGEVWLILNLIGVPCTPAEALILESLGTAIRSAAFMIPAGLGVQEGGYLLLGAALGISAPASLALSLTKRVREVLIGGPALLVWQLFEGHRLARRSLP